MPVTLMNLRRLTRQRIGVPMSDDFVTDAVLDDSINLAVQTIDAEYRWPWTEVVESVIVAPESPDIRLQSTWRATRAVFDGDTELSYVAPSDMRTWIDDVGLPRVWTPMTSTVMVRPKVQGDTTLTHHWYRESPYLVADSDTPLMPQLFTGAIVAKAAELLAQRESNGADATRHGAEYESWLQRMRRDVRRSSGGTRVRVRPGGWI